MERLKINEIADNQFYQLPKGLFINPKYYDMSIDAKVLYALLRDTSAISAKNGWVNKYGEVYLIYTREKAQQMLGLSNKSVINAFKQLKEHELIEEERRGLGKPNIIYICHMEHSTIEQSQEYLNAGTSESVETTPQRCNYYTPEVKNLHSSNTNTSNTEKNKTNNINNIMSGTINSIVDYLNEKTGKRFKSTSNSVMKHIPARLKEGYKLEDFKTVIDNKVAHWKGTDMEQYLRPETLFGNKFDGYLNGPSGKLPKEKVRFNIDNEKVQKVSEEQTNNPDKFKPTKNAF